MEYTMTINNKIVTNTSIDSIPIRKPIRSYYKTLISKHNSIKQQHDSIIYPSSRTKENEEIFNNISKLCSNSIDNRYRVIIAPDYLDTPFIFKHKTSSIKALIKYYPVHIRSSLIKTVLLDGAGDINKRVDNTIYILYNYWFINFFNSYKSLTGTEGNNFKHVTHNVCIDIEEIIRLLINKGLSLYKNYTITGELVNLLRQKLSSEEILNDTDN